MERLNCYTHNSNRGALNLKGLRGTRYRVHRFVPSVISTWVLALSRGAIHRKPSSRKQKQTHLKVWQVSWKYFYQYEMSQSGSLCPFPDFFFYFFFSSVLLQKRL